MSVIGTVSHLIGRAVAIKADGSERVLLLGDEVYADEMIRVAPDASIEIAMENGEPVRLDGGQNWLASSETYTESEDFDLSEATADVESIQAAILAGADPTEVAEETAAGGDAPAAGGQGNEGSSTVNIERTAEEVDPTAGYSTIGFGEGDEERPQYEGDLIEPVVAEVSISGPASVVEGETATYTVSIDRTPSSDVVVSVVTGNITTENGDLVPVTTDVTILAGTTSATFEVQTLDDFLADNGELYSVSITNVAGGSFDRLEIGTNSTTTLILDQTGSDNPPGPEDTVYVRLTGNDSVDEATGATLDHSVSLVDAAGNPVTLAAGESITVNLVYTADTTEGADFSTKTTQVTISGPANTADITNTVVDDYLAEGIEGYTLSVGTIVDNANTFENVVEHPTDNSVTGQISDQTGPDTPPGPEDTVYVRLTGNDSVDEATGATLDHSVSLVDAAGNPVTLAAGESITVNLVYTADTTEGADFSTKTTQVTISGPANTADITNTVVDDYLAEGIEGYTLSVGTIVDNANTFENVVEHPTDNSVTGQISDQTGPDTPPGSEDTVYVRLTGNDSVDEATGATLDHSVSLVDAAGNPVTLAAGESITVNLVYTADTTEGADFSTKTTQVTISGPANTADITNTVVDDYLAEGIEGYTLSVGTIVDNANTFENVVEHPTDNSVTGQISDQTGPDTPPGPEDTVYVRLTGNDSVDEATGATLDHSVSLVDAAGNPVTLAAGESITVNLVYTADTTEGADFSTKTTQVTISGPANTADITNTVVDDYLAEGIEGYTLSVGTIVDNANTFENVVEHPTDNSVTGQISDQTGPDTPPGPEDIVYAVISGDSSVGEGEQAAYTVSLLDQHGNPVTVTSATDVVVRFTNVSTEDADTEYSHNQDITVTIPANGSSVGLTADTVNDLLVEVSESYTMTIQNVVTSEFEAVDVDGFTDTSGTNYSGSQTTSILDNDTFSVTNAVADDDDVNENTDSDAGNNAVYTGTINNVAVDVALRIDDTDPDPSAFTSNGLPITYSWDAGSKTLTGSTSAGDVFKLTLNNTNDGYSFIQLAAIDHLPTVQGEADTAVALPFTLIAEGTGQTASFTVNVSDDAPVAGDLSITTDNDGSYDSGWQTLTTATISNDITSVEWNTANLGAIDPDTGEVRALTVDGYTVQYEDNGSGSLIGYIETVDGSGSTVRTDVLSVSIDPTNVNADMNPQYRFELFENVGRLGFVDSDDSQGTIINGGNTGQLDLGFGSYLIDSMTASSDANGTDASVNTRQGFIGVDGNWFNDNDNLVMDFQDVDGNPGQVRGINLTVEGSGNSATDVYAVYWTVTAGVDLAGTLVTYSGVFYGSGNSDKDFGGSTQTDFNFDIPLLEGAIYFTDMEVSAPELTTYPVDPASGEYLNGSYYFDNGNLIDSATGQVVTYNDGSLPSNHDNAYRIAFSGVSSNNYQEGIDFSADYTLVDADGDRSTGTVDLSLEPSSAPRIADSSIRVSEEGLVNGIADNTDGTGNTAPVPSDTTDNASVNGTLHITDYDSSSFDISLSGPAGISSDGEAVEWHYDQATGVLTGFTNSAGQAFSDVPASDYVLTIALDPVVSNGGNHSIGYTLDLLAPVDHPVNSIEDVLTAQFTVSVTDESANTTTANLTVGIEDDKPISGDISDTIIVPETKANVMLVLDFSGSMRGAELTQMKASVIEMLEAYENTGQVAVQIVSFSSGATTRNDGGWISASDAISYISGLTDSNMGGLTDYDAALAQAQLAFAESTGKIAQGNNISYFLSDGQPTDDNGTGSDGIVGAEITAWENFVTSNDIDSYAVGFAGANINALEPIAYNGVDGQERPALDATAQGSDLTELLLETVVEPSAGNLFGSLASGGFGADGDGHVTSIQVTIPDGASTKVVNFSYDGNTLTHNGAAGDNITIAGSSFIVETSNGGLLNVDMNNGNYTYTPDATLTGAITDTFVFSLRDNDGDISTGNVDLNVIRGGTPFIIQPDTVSVSEEGLANAIVDAIGNPDTTNSDKASGSISFIDADSQLADLSVSLSGPSGITSGGEAVTWTWNSANQTLTGSTASITSVMVITLSAVSAGSSAGNYSVNYSVDLNAPIDHSDTSQEEARDLDFGVVISDESGSSSSTLTVSVEDDSPVATATQANVFVPVDVISINDLQAGWTNPVFDNGTGQRVLTNTDSDSYTDSMSWGTPASGSGQSGYALVDNTQYTSGTGDEVVAGELINLGTFTHNNWPINSGSSTLDQVTLTMTMDVVINGVSTSVTFGVLLDHTETPNDGADPRDIISLPATSQVVTVAGQEYTISIEGFRDPNNPTQAVTTIYTDENAANNFVVYGSIVSTDPLPQVSGTVLSQEGADQGGQIVWGDTSSPYGTLTTDSDGNYSFQVNRDTKDGMSVDEVIVAQFNYSVVDADGDTSTAILSINIGGYGSIDGSTGNDILEATSSNDILTGDDGVDLFVWTQSDLGTAAAPDADVVVDFNTAEGDVLDLSDVLVDPDYSIGAVESDGHLQLQITNSTSDVVQTVDLQSLSVATDADAVAMLNDLLTNNHIDDGN
ncbi:retention module-containing protein [Neptuniibacter caesariensis]|uniref:Putative calcium-binding outer membrane-like protein n=1 Tax=Neptuniibacter caesariensis TaxID=207954 RepID=A0A7U8C6R2_NEPCE|nr:retention module-containing protein [Neptuniibacter caesariensis]EAR60921.1 putative calcium-binding outer membrane-like protein [Oceanospirillum sp. MED92] [Neptuniibacter caesariensis]